MTRLEEMLARQEKRLPPDSKVLQMLRDQIATQARGQTSEEIYITGSVKRSAQK